MCIFKKVLKIPVCHSCGRYWKKKFCEIMIIIKFIFRIIFEIYSHFNWLKKFLYDNLNILNVYNIYLKLYLLHYTKCAYCSISIELVSLVINPT